MYEIWDHAKVVLVAYLYTCSTLYAQMGQIVSERQKYNRYQNVIRF